MLAAMKVMKPNLMFSCVVKLRLSVGSKKPLMHEGVLCLSESSAD